MKYTAYVGDVINFKSYKLKKHLSNDNENLDIHMDVHEPIIDRDNWEPVQRTFDSKRRKPKHVEKNMFAGQSSTPSNILFVKNFVSPQSLSAENHNPEDGQQPPVPDDPGNPPDYPGDFPPNNTDKPEPQSLNDENHNSDAVDTAVQGLRKTQCSNTDSSNTDFSKINLSDPFSNGIDGKMDSHEYYEEWVKDNIEYDILVERNQSGKHYLDELVSIMVDALTSQKETIFVDGEHRPAEAVKKRLLSLESSHIEFVQECLSENTTHVKNIKAYLLTCLWRAPETMNHRYMMLVNHHFKGGVGGK